jgi:hypothetical protein
MRCVQHKIQVQAAAAADDLLCFKTVGQQHLYAQDHLVVWHTTRDTTC